MARLHFPLLYQSSGTIRIRKLNDDDVAKMPDDLPEPAPPPAPVADADVRLTAYADDGSTLPDYDALALTPYGDPAFASYRVLIDNVTLAPGHYDATVVVTHTDGRVVRRSALISVSDE